MSVARFHRGELCTTLEWIEKTRPWWWWVNPWLYIRRRDRAYANTLDAMKEGREYRSSGGEV